MPAILKKKIANGEVPDDLLKVILGNSTKAQKMKILMENDDFYFLLLPKGYVEAIRVRLFLFI